MIFPSRLPLLLILLLLILIVSNSPLLNLILSKLLSLSLGTFLVKVGFFLFFFFFLSFSFTFLYLVFFLPLLSYSPFLSCLLSAFSLSSPLPCLFPIPPFHSQLSPFLLFPLPCVFLFLLTLLLLLYPPYKLLSFPLPNCLTHLLLLQFTPV